MQTIQNRISGIKSEFFAQLNAIVSRDTLEQCRITFLGRNGKVAELMTELKQLSLEDKKIVGPLLNDMKEVFHEAFRRKEQELIDQEMRAEFDKDASFDVTAYVPGRTQGTLHPLTHMLQKVEDIFVAMGYQVVHGPEVETEEINFGALNIPEDHPARDMWDTLWLQIPGLLLRTHTSSVQIHSMKNIGVPLAILAPGRAYRHEATDATHDFMFNQIECLVIDRDISLSHLLGTIQFFFRSLFSNNKLEVRVRPSYFPFVEPGVEVDISCPFCQEGCSPCKQSGWIEIGGAGLVHPTVLQGCSIDPEEYSGFAFGLGLDRITMLLYGIKDIRLFSQNSLQFLEQF